VHAWRQADNQQARARIAERRDRARMILRILPANFAQELGKPRATRALQVE
jgi:hypothetical protein